MEMDDRKRAEWIDQYLMDQLSEAELRQFNHYLQTEHGFRQELEVQQALFLQARKVGREALRRQLKSLHQSLESPWPVKTYQAPPGESGGGHRAGPSWNAVLRFPRLALAATLVLVLLAAGLAYLRYTQPPDRLARPVPGTGNPGGKPQLAHIRLQVVTENQNLGFAGAGADTTVAVLLYRGETGSRSYRFDDTLRLYGPFEPARLRLQEEETSGRYTLREDSLYYPLQRYHARQALVPAR